MDIKIEPEILKKAKENGATEEEIDATIRTGKDLNSETGLLGKSRTFPFKAERNNIFFEQKKLDVYFSVESKVITAIAVDVFYGTFS
jgi:hypothetical protein